MYASSKRDFEKRWGWSALLCGWIFGAPAVHGCKALRRGQLAGSLATGPHRAANPPALRGACATLSATAFLPPRLVRYISIYSDTDFRFRQPVHAANRTARARGERVLRNP